MEFSSVPGVEWLRKRSKQSVARDIQHALQVERQAEQARLENLRSALQIDAPAQANYWRVRVRPNVLHSELATRQLSLFLIGAKNNWHNPLDHEKYPYQEKYGEKIKRQAEALVGNLPDGSHVKLSPKPGERLMVLRDGQCEVVAPYQAVKFTAGMENFKLSFDEQMNPVFSDNTQQVVLKASREAELSSEPITPTYDVEIQLPKAVDGNYSFLETTRP